jgi:O-succinylbenzoic acid--CoA ligase
MTAPRRYTALVPTQLHRLATANELESLRGFDAVLVGGGAVRPDLAQQAADASLRLVRTYGASETCGGCVYDGVPLDGVAVRLGTDGRVHIAGSVLFDGYDGRPDLTAQVLRDGWFTSGDLGHLDDDGRLHVVGRADDVAVTGGVKVPLAVVTAALQALPGVRDAIAVAVPDAEWGARVVAVVAGDTELGRLRDQVAATLPREWAPRGLVLLDALPLLGVGKVDRVAVEALAARA